MNNSDIASVDPNTGEPGRQVPRPKFTNKMAQAKMSPPQEVELDAGEIEQLLISNGLTVLQSASDYTQGVITFVVTKQ